MIEVKIWNRDINGDETVEDVLAGSKGPSQTINLCKGEFVGQGESVAISKDGRGFYTVSEAPGENEARVVNVPIFYYSLNKGNFIKPHCLILIVIIIICDIL